MTSYAFQKAVAEAEKALARAGIDGAELETPKEFGDLALACFPLAKKFKKKPGDVATELAGRVRLGKNFADCEATDGYLNLFFSDAFYAGVLSEAAEKGFGENDFGKGKTVVIDYSSPNVGKPLHIGHIRSTILGDSIKRLLAFTGHKAVGSNYLCDAGMQTARLMVALDLYDASRVKSAKDLLAYYVRVSKEIEGNAGLEEKARDFLEKMESGDKSVWRGLKRVRELSVKPLQDNYALLGVEFEEEVFDSDFVPQAKLIVEEAIQKKVAFKDQTKEVVVELEEHGLPNFVLMRSNDTTLYSTRDLALADYRFGKHGFNECVYVTSSEQDLHFQQVFKTIGLLGRPYAAGLKHVGFGLIFLKGMQKLSSRAGNVLLLEDVLKDVVKAARDEVRKREHSYPDTLVAEIAEQVGVGATKFAVLRVSPEKSIVFDPKTVASFEGFTGAYLQYTLVRTRGILGKAKKTTVKPAEEFNDEERRLAKQLALFPGVVGQSARNLHPHVLCNFLLEVASAFSKFYDKHPVLQAEPAERSKRLLLVKATENVLETGLGLLGIKAPEKM